MATDGTRDDLTDLGRFKELDPGVPRLCLSEADLFAYVTVMGGAWAWVVWRNGLPVAGRRDRHMDSVVACREVLAALKAIKENKEVTLGT